MFNINYEVDFKTLNELLDDELLDDDTNLYTIREVFKRKKNTISLKDDEKYNLIGGVKLGCYESNVELLGRDIKGIHQSCTDGQFIISSTRRLAYGIITPSIYKNITSNNHWVFDINTEIANAKYLVLIYESQIFNQYGCYRDFLDATISLPTKEQQDIIVEEYERLAFHSYY
jgi:hypothetical protein